MIPLLLSFFLIPIIAALLLAAYLSLFDPRPGRRWMSRLHLLLSATGAWALTSGGPDILFWLHNRRELLRRRRLRGYPDSRNGSPQSSLEAVPADLASSEVLIFKGQVSP